ncbi:MAG: sulfotransferase [Pseudomonadota bacterium]
MGKFRHVFIVTYGRTGSTLLMNVLNGIEGYHIKGENADTAYHLSRAHASAAEMARRLAKGSGRDQPASPLYATRPVGYEALRDEIGAAIDRIVYATAEGEGPPRYRVFGFKDVSAEIRELEAYLDFLAARYEDAAFIFLTRAHEELATSGFWRLFRRGQRANRLRKMEERWKRFAYANESRCFALDYADLRPGAAPLEALFAFLGEDPDRDAVAEIMKPRYSYPSSPLWKARGEDDER